ncbi:MAG: NADH:ubiquinone oxidoreductase subunit NDUFA12 [Rhodobacteraceae bacterium]|nr:NADH:ubiquinone oxidoreductase subunit NDUFA12 [Paracoccaceae bacterium]
MKFIKRLLTWWNGQTLGTQLYTRLRGQPVGQDGNGNKFYQNADGSRRWVIYDGEMEASRVSPEWHGWLHHTFRLPPTEDPFPKRSWQKPHVENLTGTEDAYAPVGSLRSGEATAKADYVAWKPE